MPTISQLPPASQVTAADQIPISQGGSACSVSVGALLSGTQPAILATTGTLLGRTSLGPGGPDPIGVGIGLLLDSDNLVATGADHANFATQGSLVPSDQVVLSSEGSPRLLPLTLLRGLFAAGPNISIDQNGTISTELPSQTVADASGFSITALPIVDTIQPDDLVAVSHSGTDHAISYGNLINGQTIDQAQVAAAVSDFDTFWVAQGSDVMLRQTMGSLWAWLCLKFPTYMPPTIELTGNTTLNSLQHNGRILICSQAITLTAAPLALGNAFSCRVLNLSAGNVTFSSGITTSTGASCLSEGQTASVTCVVYSGGTVVYAFMGSI